MQEGEELGPRTMRNHMGQSDDQEVDRRKYFDGLLHAGHYYPLPLPLPQDLKHGGRRSACGGATEATEGLPV